MDAPFNIKSGGLRFAEQHMKRHGWTEGKGLGKREDGISKAIKVKVKCNTAGVGHNSAEQFTFHWWDHVFNKTASSIAVEPNQDGVQVKNLSEDGSAVSSKKPRKAMLCRNMLYGRFIKSATLTSGGEQPMAEPPSSDSSDSSEDEDSKLDLSSATKVSDEDLMRICGGRTAHKGARHGLNMSAKLSRIEEQERAFMEKYGKKETKPQPSKSTEEITGEDEKMRKKKKRREGNINGKEQDNSDVPKKKKKKRKKEETEESVINGQEHVPSAEEDPVRIKKRKVPDNVEVAEDAEVLPHHKTNFSVEDENGRHTKKKKRKTIESEESSVCKGHTKDGRSRPEKEDEEHENAEEEAGKSKKKKKKKKHKRTEDQEERAACPEEESRKWRAEEGDDPSTEDGEEGRSRRKKKKLVDDEDQEEDDARTSKKKKSKHKDRRD